MNAQETIESQLWLAKAYLLRREFGLAGQCVDFAQKTYRDNFCTLLNDGVANSLSHAILEVNVEIVMTRPCY